MVVCVLEVCNRNGEAWWGHSNFFLILYVTSCLVHDLIHALVLSVYINFMVWPFCSVGAGDGWTVWLFGCPLGGHSVQRHLMMAWPHR
jgi:hypothetical protein